MQLIRVCVCCSPQQTKVYQHSCHNTMEAHNKLMKMKEKQGTGRKKKGKDKEVEVRDLKDCGWQAALLLLLLLLCRVREKERMFV